MNKHKPECLMMQPIPFPLTDGYPQRYCTCGLDRVPPPPCPHCNGTGRLTMPEKQIYDPTNDVTDLHGIPADPTGSD